MSTLTLSSSFVGQGFLFRSYHNNLYNFQEELWKRVLQLSELL